jgi:adenosylmethionine-8-amino-7-oxononanoate aminotransferase
LESVPGTAGVLVPPAGYLEGVRALCDKYKILWIADEVMAGFGRTGEWFASQHANVKPDLMCLSKGLTAGSIPMSCVLVDHEIYQLFYGEINSAFLHSHTFSGNALGVSAALATLEVMAEENICQQAQQLGEVMQKAFFEVADLTGQLSNIRGIGGLIAADLSPSSQPRLAFHLRQEALKRGALLRPFGNTLYWLPPLNTSKEMIEQLAEITLHSIEAVYKNER